MITYLACWTGWTFEHIRYKMTFDEFMMAYDYAGQLHGVFSKKKRSGKEDLKAEIEAIYEKVGKKPPAKDG